MLKLSESKAHKLETQAEVISNQQGYSKTEASSVA
jgi:hypothetical protein